MLKKSGQNRSKEYKTKTDKKISIYPQIVLATLSQTRINMFKQTGIPFVFKQHNVDEEKIKKSKYDKQKENLALTLAEAKARSIADTYPDKIVVGSDQILICENKLFSKPRDLKEAEKNLIYLVGKHHFLWSAVVAIKSGKIKFSILTKAHIYFRNISRKNIQNYVKKNSNTVLSSVGSYKIEDNAKYGFIKVLAGSEETIRGFPIQKFINTLA